MGLRTVGRIEEQKKTSNTTTGNRTPAVNLLLELLRFPVETA